MDLIGEGAEAKIFQVDKLILKYIRLPKTYRIPIIDTKLRKNRNKREFKILTKLYENKLNVPKPIQLIENKEEMSFTFEYIKGNTLKNTINKQLLEKAFNEIIKMHNLDITHGDLTTLNMIETEKIYLIDFGLAQFSSKYEDKAVDLNLFFNCIKNEHPKLHIYKNTLIQKYLKGANDSNKVIEKLEKLELRGRNK